MRLLIIFQTMKQLQANFNYQWIFQCHKNSYAIPNPYPS